jgi:elongation factor G
MPVSSSADLRNVVLMGHNASGKTSLADMLLFKAKAVPRRGSLDEGTSLFDLEPEEKERKATIELGVATCSWEGKEINLLDTPGYSDLIGQTLMGLAAAEVAFVCVNAFSGIMVNTRKVMEEARKTGIARAVVITKVDQENVDLGRLIEEVRETFGRECVPLSVPDKTGGGASRIVNLLSARAEAPAPFQKFADEAIEKIVEADDRLLEKYLESGQADPAEVMAALPKAMTSGRIIPILCCSVEKDLGVDDLLNFIVKNCPSPLDRPRRAVDLKTGEEKEFPVQLAGPFLGFTFKVVGDPFVKKYVYVKVMSGGFTSSAGYANVKAKKGVSLPAIYKPFGKDLKNQLKTAASVIAGDIAVATKVEEAQIGDTIGDAALGVAFKEFPLPSGVISLAVEPKSKPDEAKMFPSLTKMMESDPTFKVSRDAQTGEFVITGMGQLHLEITLARMKRIYEAQVTTKTPKIPFKETVTSNAEGHHKHKKQTGGHGQYGEAYLRLAPNERGKGFEFVDEIVGGKIPSNYIPSVEKGVRKILERGILAGYPIVDVKCSVFDGSYHDVDSSNESFEIAGYQAFLDGFMKARPVLLEPIVNMDVFVPGTKIGDVTGQIVAKRGLILTVEAQGNFQVVKSKIPLQEISNYSSELNSATAGEGYYTIEFSHFDVVPSNIAQKVIDRAKREREEAK